MPSLIGTTSGGVSIAANYLKAVQSPGAALGGLNAQSDAPFLTFSTPNLRGFKVIVSGTSIDLATSSEDANSQWSRVIRALQVTSELFAVFAPNTTTFVYMAPDFNTNAGPATTAGNPLSTPLFTNVETAIADALQAWQTENSVTVDGAATVTYSTCTATSWS